MNEFDLSVTPVRDLNQALHDLSDEGQQGRWIVRNPEGEHSIAVGVDADVDIEIDGPVGYFCGGMCRQARITVNGNAGQGIGENMESGVIHVCGDASQSAGATGRGGFLLIEGNASARCGISMKGNDIVVKGDVGHLSGFMAQAGRMVVFGDAGEALGDSLYEAHIYVRGCVAGLGADCMVKEMRDEHRKELHALLERAGEAGRVDVSDFTRYGSARELYTFHIDKAGAY